MKSVFGFNIIPENDADRVKALNRYFIFNTPSEPSYNKIAQLAKSIFKTPIVHLSFMDADSESIKASIGLGSLLNVDRGESMCALTVFNSELTVFEDALQEPLLNNHPYVHGPFGLRFYAGAPLKTPDGFIIGTLCLVDKQPRQFSDNDREILQNLADVAMEQTELRLSTLRETQKQVDTNDKLSASEQRLQSILDTMSEGVGIINQDGQMVYANSMAQNILGLSEGEIKERTFYDKKWHNLKVDGTPLDKDEHPMAIVLRTGKPVYDFELALQPENGEPTYISVNAAPIIDPHSGKVTGGIGTFMDVTNRRKLQKQKEEFIDIASHGLKTPVTSLKASLQMLDRMKDNLTLERLNKLVSQSNKSLDKLSNLIGDLLDANRISPGHFQLHYPNFKLSEVIEECYKEGQAAAKHNIVLKGETEISIYADRRQISQVVTNLVNNAAKYAPDSKTIEISVDLREQDIKIAVKDFGPGIPLEKIRDLFERYFSTEYSGPQFPGLGLYISKEIVEKHGGHMHVDSVLNEGSTFWFTLPIKNNKISSKYN